MKTLLRLLAMLVTCAGLFALSWHLFNRERKPPPPPKTTQELLVGTWEIIEHDPPLPPGYSATIEFTRDGKEIIRLVVPGPKPNIVVVEGVYRLEGKALQCDTLESENNCFATSKARIEMLTDDTLILVWPEGQMKRAVHKRVPQ